MPTTPKSAPTLKDYENDFIEQHLNSHGSNNLNLAFLRDAFQAGSLAASYAASCTAKKSHEPVPSRVPKDVYLHNRETVTLSSIYTQFSDQCFNGEALSIAFKAGVESADAFAAEEALAQPGAMPHIPPQVTGAALTKRELFALTFAAALSTNHLGDLEQHTFRGSILSYSTLMADLLIAKLEKKQS